MKRAKAVIPICLVVALAACGVGELSVGLPPTANEDGNGQTLKRTFSPGRGSEHQLPFRITGGIPPYAASIEGCPDWVTLFPDQGILAGTPPVSARGQTFFCRYVITDSDTVAEPQTASFGLQLVVEGLGDFTFQSDPAQLNADFSALQVGMFDSLALPAVMGGVPPYTYTFTCAGGTLPPGMGFEPTARVFAGTPTAAFRDTCAYTAMDSSQPAERKLHSFEVTAPAPERDDLSIVLDGGGDTLEFDFFPGRAVQHRLPLEISGGVDPYVTMLDGCPDWVTLFPDQRIIAGAPPRPDRPPDDTAFVCRYVVTDSDTLAEPQTASIGLRLIVAGQGQVRLPSGPGDLVLRVGTYREIQFPPADSGIPPYSYTVTCTGEDGSNLERELPPGMSFDRVTRVFSGTPTAEDDTQPRYSCTYTVTDSLQPTPGTASWPFEVIVDPLDIEQAWRFRTRARSWSERPFVEGADFVTLPKAAAVSGATDADVSPEYSLDRQIEPPLDFENDPPKLKFIASGGVDHVFNILTTYRYQASLNGVVQDALCLDIRYHDNNGNGRLHTAFYRLRDATFLNAGVYQCPPADPTPSTTSRRTSNPVHSALAPVHARRAVDVAHTAVRGRVRSRTPGTTDGWTLSPSVDVASLSGLSRGFDYSGSSRSLRVGAEAGAGAWQTGLVAAFTETELRYRAEAGLAQLGYRSGEHDTGIVSLHPFVAWHARSGGHLWMSIGAGRGELRHRDAPNFPFQSSSDIRLQAYGLEGTVPLAELFSGTLDAEAGVESFAFDIDGGGQISAVLPTLRGRDYRAGLAWHSPVPGTPSVSVAYRRLTGDGPEGALVEMQGSFSSTRLFNPRFSLQGTVAASLGFGDHEHDSLSLGASARFAPDRAGRGLDISFGTRLVSSAGRGPVGLGVRGETGYGLWAGPYFGKIRPYAGLLAYPGGISTRRTIGLDLLDTPPSRVNIEVYDHDRRPASGLHLNLHHRF